MMNPVVVRSDGANIERTTVQNVSHSGTKIISEKDLPGIIAKLIAARNPDKDRIINCMVN
jgi:hypothetical protein